MLFYSLGQYAEAQSYFEEAKQMEDANPSTIANPLGGADPAILIRMFGFFICVSCGYLDRAEALAIETLMIVEQTNHMPTRAWGLNMKIRLPLLRGEYSTALQGGRELFELRGAVWI